MNPGKVDRQPAYILHARPYRETSLLLEILTPDHGRLGLVARGARRPRAELRGLLLPFQPLTLSWFGKNEVRTLHAADWQGGVRQLAGLPLICGFYLNELLMHLLVREDPHRDIWRCYDRTVRGLAAGEPPGALLRRFELALVGHLGYAPTLDEDEDGAAVDAARWYVCQPGQRPAPDRGFEPDNHQAIVSGATLLAMAADDFSAEQTRRESRGLLRLMLEALLEPDVRLASRELLQSLAPQVEQEPE
ncbi:MAG: DNA repair protein RecO [Paludibacterium sp.]|uniref:DNA repair protein RecO n=1 Tax=Paludibacterium sp. TaxID=1917523 RepID=UPI0025EF1E40|nr:DNA repair protein RecO [Paludibacterium sp.]MBV8048268.1 DNA repair protein RecO [Paludibacterium sp.]MBV8647196.1 DNA repair protein RecO [Paludibacterium sp.]